MSVFSSLREVSGRRVFEGVLFFIFLPAILITSGCVGVVSGNGGPGNQPTPQGAITISNIQANAPTSSGFQVGWLTNVPADSQIDYGTSAAYGSTTPLSTTAVTVHQVTLTGLTTGTLYHYRVRSADSKKNQALSSDFTFATSGDTTPPMVSITSPASGATLAGTAVVVANAQDNLSVASVQFKVDGTNSGPSLTTPPYSYSLNTNSLSNGNHTLTAMATDAAGNTASSAAVPFVVSNLSTAPPVVLVTAPASGATVSGTVTVTASATSSIGVASVQFQLDGANVGSPVTAAPYSYSWDTTKSSNGSHTLKGIAKDAAGTSTMSAGDTVNVKNAVAAPVVSITAPASGATVSGTTTATANATSSIGVASVQFQLDGANVGSPVTAAPYSYSWDTTKSSNGSHTLKAVAKDAAGTSTTSAGDTVNVNNTVAPPVVSITAPANGATVSGTITVSGTASSSLSISSVQVSVDGGSFSNASGTNTWNFGLDTASLSNATHSLTAKAIDNSGGTASSSVVSISVNNAVGPTVTINWSDVHQQIDGFGASSAATGDGMTDSQADLFWSTTSGVGLSLLRVQIESNGTYPDLATMQKAQDRGVKIWGTPWSPPASMKSNGSTTNGGSLLASDYQAYANYLSSYVLGLKNSYGINLYALSIQNEPDYTATWDSCIWTGQQFHDFLRNNLLPTFSKNGVTAKIIMPEESGWKFDLATATLNDSVTAAGVSIIAGHNYDGASAAPYPLGQNQGKHLWETEVSTFETFDPSMTNGLKWAKKINDWMTIANANAWHYWWLIDGNGDNEALLGPSGQTTKRLYVMGNYSKFVRPGYYRIGTSASPVGGVLVSAYKNTSSGKFAIVAINQNTSAVTLDFVLSGFTANTVVPWVTSASLNLAQQSSITVGGSAFVTTLPAASVTTFVGP
jgi:O-glycosyl hydrolase